MQFQLTDSIRKTAGEIFLSLVSLAYIFFTAVWLLPDSTWKTTLKAPVEMWWPFLGLRQRWSMFSPRLRKVNQHVIATLTFEDGTSMVWEPPRMERLKWQDRFRLEKFRKWDVDYLPYDVYQDFWPDLARYVARLNYNGHNRPSLFELHTYSAEIPDVNKTVLSRGNLPAHTNYNTIFVYKYSAKDFQ